MTILCCGVKTQSTDVANATRRVKDIKRVMKDIWEESKSYRISDHVHMTEKQLLSRLRSDGVLPAYDEASLASKKMDPLHVCFLFRCVLHFVAVIFLLCEAHSAPAVI